MANHLPETPISQGFSMPAEWAPHAGCLMAWPARKQLWGPRFDDAKQDYATVASAIAAFEPVLMVCNPGDAADVRRRCGHGVDPLEIPINDSWARDSGPIFVCDPSGQSAVVQFGFNAWGGRWEPHDDDARLATRVAEELGLPVFTAPMVLEGGAFFVDGEGTLLTTEQCLLNPNRNGQLNREQIEQILRAYLGVRTIVWLPHGHVLDVGPEGTDGHVDGVAQYLAPGRVLLEVTSDRNGPDYQPAHDNLAALRAATDAEGRAIDVSLIDPGPDPKVSYANHYLPNGGVIVPVSGGATDGPALARLQEIYPDREIVGVPGDALAYGGGGPHCVTQQIPQGAM